MSEEASIGPPDSFKAVVALWPDRDAMASDVGANTEAIRKWSERNRIPPEWWAAVIGTERATAAGVTADLMTRLAAREREVA